MKTVSFLAVRYLCLLLAIGIPLVACSKPTPVQEEPLFDDSDLDNASLEVDRTVTEISPSTVLDGSTNRKRGSPARQIDTQALLPEAKGVIVYLVHNPSHAEPWSIMLFDLRTEEPLVLYRGRRELQSVAIDTIDTIVFTARETVSASSDFEVFRVSFRRNKVTRITDTVEDERNVSSSADGNLVAWEGVSASGRRAVLWRDIGEGQSYRLATSNDDVMPTISADGERFAFVQRLSNGDDRIALFEIGTRTLTDVFTSAAPKEHPSPAAEGAMVAWTEISPDGEIARVKTGSSEAPQDLFASADGITHTNMVESGRWLTYSLFEDGRWQLTIRDLEAEDDRVAAGPSLAGDDYGTYWRLSYECTVTPDNAQSAIRPTGSLTCDPTG